MFFMDFPSLAARHAIKPRGVLHLGAHVGQEAEVYAAAGIPRVVWVEANPNVFGRLTANISRFQGHSAHLAAISDRDGEEALLLLASNEESSSLLRMKLHRERYPGILQDASVKVRTTTVDSFLGKEGIAPATLDFVNMDLQGAEMRALAGMAAHLPYVRYLYTEVNFEELYEGCCLFKDLRPFLEKNGFRLAELKEVENGWGEALFTHERS